MRGIVLVALALAWVALATGCDGGDPLPASDFTRTDSAGPRVNWDPGRTPFPEIPVPNDVATSPDPHSPTGLRINAAVVAPTLLERNLRRDFDSLDGWGTFMPLTVSFDADLDLADLARRHQGDDFDLRDDAIYLIDLDTGLPVPLDLGNGHYPLTLRDPQGILPNDPRAGGSNLLLATLDEDTNHDGILQPGEDTNFDGVMQRAAVFPAGARPEDALTTHWEPESRTLIARPMLPLRERTRYAVVLTDRLRGANGPVRSPFPTLGHPSQLGWLHRIEQHLANPELSRRFYGDLSWNPADTAQGSRVAFAWTFATQTTVTDLRDVYNGLHGSGRLASLASVTPDFTVRRARGGSCTPDQLRNLYILPRAELVQLMQRLTAQLGFGGAQGDALIASYDWVDYIAIAAVQTPYLLGDPNSGDPDARWDLDAVAAHGPPARDTVQVWIFVPRSRPGASAPFPVALAPHGYSIGAYQGLAFAGYFARFGIATVAANAPGHGFFGDPSIRSAVPVFLREVCGQALGAAALEGRSRDVNGDGVLDSGADVLTAQVFHTRDMLRQTALDYMQIIRALTDPGFSQPGAVDYNGDGRNDAPGDLNGDGTVDIGGTTPDGHPRPVFMWGESLGGITSMLLGALDPALTAVVPVSGGAGLTDVTLKTTVDGVQGAVLGPTLGPVIVTVPVSERGPVNGHRRTGCNTGEMSLRWVVPDGAGLGELEIACIAPGTRMQPGDDVVAVDIDAGSVRCARVGPDGRLFLPLPVDRGDRVSLTVYQGAAVSDYSSCRVPPTAPRRIDALHEYEIVEGDCDFNCGHVPDARPGAPVLARPIAPRPASDGAPHPPLTAPASGLGLRRQSAELRRFIQLAQMGIDAADPANFAPLFFLRPLDGAPHPLLTMTTVGDTDVPVAAGNTFARIAGLEPFIRRPTGTPLDEYVAPSELLTRYDRTPDALLREHYVFEGLARLERFPVAQSPRYLFDADDLDDGRQPFGEAQLSPPLRLARAAAPVRDPRATVFVDDATATTQISAAWQVRAGAPVASFVNAYVAPEGTHTFLPSDPSQPWDSGLYLTNLVARFFQSGGTDVEYVSNPAGHQCLANSSCAFIPQTP